MIPKGSQRGGGQHLATHLLNAFDNETTEIHEVRGAAAQDLHGAFAEWRGQAKATKCEKYIYHLMVNPDHRQREFSRQDYMDFIERAEKNLGLTDQPRAIVFHVKNGREHAHAVWSRIEITPEKIRGINIHKDQDRLNDTAREWARDHEITLPEGMTRDRKDKDFSARKRRENHQEKQQQERSGISKADRMKTITDAWNRTRTGAEFIKALEASGYRIARGDRRAYVAIDLAGEVHSLARQIDGANAKQLAARLIEFPIDSLPTIEKAREQAKAASAGKLKEKFNVAQIPTIAQRQQNLKTTQARRRAALNADRDEMVFRHHAERAALRQLQTAETRGAIDTRGPNPSKPLIAFLARITGIQLLRDFQQRRQGRQRTERHREQVKLLVQKHDRERQELDRQARDLTAVETRERLSLQTAIHRAEFMAMARLETDKQTDQGKETGSLTEAFRIRAAQKEHQQARHKGRGRDRDPGRQR